MKKMLVPLLAAALLALCLSACGGNDSTASASDADSSQPVLYFVSEDETGSAVKAEAWNGDPEDVGAMLDALMAGPEEDGLSSPFLAGTYVRSWSVADGVATVDMSESYGGLSGMDLTLANYCLTLTLCQASSVDEVTITVMGEPIANFSHQTLQPDEVITEGVPSE